MLLYQNIVDDWRYAINCGVDDEYYLIEMFKTDSKLAKSWLLNEREYDKHYSNSVFYEACGALSHHERIEVAKSLRKNGYYHQIIKSIVGADSDVFEVLLKREDLDESKLIVLNRCKIDDTWRELAILALDYNHSQQQIIHYSLLTIDVMGDYEQYFKRKKKDWSNYLKDGDVRITELAQLGINTATEEAEYYKRYTSSSVDEW